MKQNICPTCEGLKITKLILTTEKNAIEPNKEIVITSEEFDIGFYMSKRKWNDSPWYLQYSIELNGKFDREAISNHQFLSDGWKKEMERQRISDEYKKSCEKLKKLLSFDNGWTIYGFSKQITFEDNRGRKFRIDDVDSTVPQQDGKFTSLSFIRKEGYSLESDIVK